MYSELTADEHTVLLIAGKGENMIPIGRWEKPIRDLADRGLMREIDSVNYVITAKGRRALENEEQAENEALKGALNKVRGVEPDKVVDKISDVDLDRKEFERLRARYGW